MNAPPDDNPARDEAGPVDLLPAVYQELRGLARHLLRDERASHTLQPTALVHEAWVRLAKSGTVSGSDRLRFLAAAATAMRRLLIDHARRRSAGKRGAGVRRVTLDEGTLSAKSTDVDLVALDEVLTQLALLHERQSRVVELRYFAGLTIAETAQALGVGTTTVEDDWAMARAWLSRRLGGGVDGS